MRTKCQHCNTTLQFDERKYIRNNWVEYTCPVCGNQVRFQYGVADQQISVTSQDSPVLQPVKSNFQSQPTPVSHQNIVPPVYEEEQQRRSPLIWLVPVLVLLFCAVIGGYFYYNKVYLPAKIDREAPRYYTISNMTNLRSSKSAGAEYNKIGSIPFGSELITYSHEADWSEVKDATGKRGFIASNYIVEKSDFYRLNSIFGDASSREIIQTVKCRRALLNYFKEHNYIGSISQSELGSVTPQVVPNSDNQWQVFTRSRGVTPNSVWFGRAINSDSKFTDFAVIITNIKTGAHRFLLFCFDETEKPTLVYEENTSAKYIENVYCYDGSDVEVDYYYAR